MHVLIATQVAEEGGSATLWLTLGVLVVVLGLAMFAAWWRGRHGRSRGAGWQGPLGPEDGERGVAGAIDQLRNTPP